MEFIEQECRIMADHLLGKHLFRTKGTKKDGKSQSLDSKSKMPVKDHIKGKYVNVITVGESSPPKPCCVCCNKQHYLNGCDDLKAKPHEERLEFVQRNSLCFGCLRKGHSSKDCRRRKVCQVCKGRHPTLLHRDSATQGKAE